MVIGLAHPKRECWVLAGWAPQTEAEVQSLKRAKQELGFDPCRHAERLTARHDDDKLSAKRVLEFLTQGNLVRERQCWEEAELNTLRERGEKTGLRAYLQELAELLGPLL